jgi:hypothetical protein
MAKVSKEKRRAKDLWTRCFNKVAFLLRIIRVFTSVNMEVKLYGKTK